MMILQFRNERGVIMDDNYRQALTEVLEVLNHTEKELVEKLPQDFVTFLLQNLDRKYIPDIDFSLDNWETSLKEDAKAILAYIYKEYLATEQEKSTLLTDSELVQKGEEMLKKYGVEDLFQQNETKTIEPITENIPIEIKSTPWYKKIFQKFLNLFK